MATKGSKPVRTPVGDAAPSSPNPLSLVQRSLKTVEWVELDSISAAEYNPQKMTPEVVEDTKRSIMRFGFVDPMVVNRRVWDNGRLVMVGGHKRKVALKLLEDEGRWRTPKGPCVILELSPVEEMALNVALNKIHDEFNYELLTKVLKDIRGQDRSILPSTGMKEHELTPLFAAVWTPPPIEKGATKTPVVHGGISFTASDKKTVDAAIVELRKRMPKAFLNADEAKCIAGICASYLGIF